MSLSPSGPQPRRLAGCFVISWTDRAGTSSGLHQGSHTFLFKFQCKHFLFCGFLMLLFIIRGWRWSTYGINLTYSLINIYRLKNSKKEGTKKIFYLSIKGFSSILPETKSRFTTSEMKNHPSTFTQKFTSQKLSFSSSPHCLFCLSLFLTFIIIICSTSPFIWIHYLQSVESFAYFFFCFTGWRP